RGGLLRGRGLVLYPEEALEAAQPHLQLEEVAGVAAGLHLVEPVAHLAAQEVGGRLPGLAAGARAGRAVASGHHADRGGGGASWPGNVPAALLGTRHVGGAIIRPAGRRPGSDPVPAPPYDWRLFTRRSLP